MKKRFLILAGVLALTVAVSGCGKKKDTDVQPVAASATPTPEVTKAAEIVDMKQSTEEEIANIMGEESATASKVIFVNNMGSDISSVYIRKHVEDEDDSDDDTWGSDLVDGKFTLKDKDKALYYFSPNATEDSTKNTASYDIRVGFSDEDKNECFFRDIPLGTISQITLCMSGTDEDAIPYAKYLTGSTKREISTLNDVKKRLGMTDDSDSTDDQNTNSDNSDNSSQNTDSDSNSNADNSGNTDDNNSGSNSNSGDDNNNGDDNNGGNDNSGGDDMISTAEKYVGQSIDALQSACGSPQGSSYETDPETGKTGFYYYSNFTVSTTVDENGNEIVANIW